MSDSVLGPGKKKINHIFHTLDYYLSFSKIQTYYKIQKYK